MAAKRTSRRNSVIVAAIFYFIAFVFLILVEIGNTSIKPVLKDIYFFKLDVSDVIPVSVPNAMLLNSVARTLGLHDFYQVGLWNFCQGYNVEGFTDCSQPEALWWFNPIEILTDQLLAGASIALPQDVNTILTILRIGQQVMFGFFLTGLILAVILLLASPIVLRSRWWSLPMAVLAFIDAVLVTVASIIGTVMSVGAKFALTAQDELNLRAEIGIRMFVFMWIASVCVVVAFFIHAILGCCCRIDRSEKNGALASGVTNGSSDNEPAVEEKKKTGSGRKNLLPAFVRRRNKNGTSADPVES